MRVRSRLRCVSAFVPTARLLFRRELCSRTGKRCHSGTSRNLRGYADGTFKENAQHEAPVSHRRQNAHARSTSDITNGGEVVTFDLVVVREQYDSLGDCLANKESVERVTMKRREGGDLECVLRFD